MFLSSVRFHIIRNIPPRNPDFTGKNLILDEARKFLNNTVDNSPKRIILTGPTGIGKSELAIEYAYRYSSAYRIIWRIDAYHGISVQNDLEDLCEKLFPDRKPEIQTLHDWLAKNPKWLLIFDNVAEKESINEFFPEKGKGHIIIITDKPVSSAIDRECPVDSWNRDETVAYLHKKTGCINVKSVIRLAEALPGLPLGVVMAAAWCTAKPDQPLENIHQMLTCLDQHSVDDVPAIFTVLCKLCLGELNDIPQAKQILIFCCVLSSFPVPEYLVRRSLEIHRKISGTSGIPDEATFAQSLDILEQLALIKRSSSSVTLHRIVKNALLSLVNHAELVSCWEAALLSLKELFPVSSYHDPSTWKVCADLFEHALSVLSGVNADTSNSWKEYCQLQDAAAMYLHARMFFNDAEKHYRNSLEIREKLLGHDNPEVATTINNLALLYWDWDRFDDAESYYHESIKIRESLFGKNHPEVATSINNLALLLWEQERYMECEVLYRRALLIRKEGLGGQHILTAESLNNLAGLFFRIKKLHESESLFRNALEIYEKQLGAGHPDLITPLTNLAAVMQAEEKHEELETLCYRILSIHERQLKRNHPEIASILCNLAGVLEAQGKFSEAIAVYRRALEINEKNLGTEDPSSEASRLRLALLTGIIA